MTAENAWKSFTESGLITDYLKYKTLLKEEGEASENQYKGAYNQGLGAPK